MTAQVKQSNQPSYACTPLSDIATKTATTKQTFYNGRTLPAEYRRVQLEKFYQMMVEHEELWISAVQSDMKGRPSLEIGLTELSGVRSEIAHMLNQLSTYMSPKKMASSAAFLTDSGYFHYNPMGCVLLISPWNFPVSLTFIPLAGIIASGCTAVIKPSEVSHHTAALMAQLIPRYLDPRAYTVVLGGPTETSYLLREFKFDLIFFTGGCNIGKVVAKAAAEKLTPMVLELGGKNPVVVDVESGVDLHTVCKRIAWGRWCLNAGQVCLSPEYVIISRQFQEVFIREMTAVLVDLFGENPQLSPDYARIINASHFQRLCKVLDENRDSIVHGGKTDDSECYISPTILANISINGDPSASASASASPIMSAEVFGPLLSIVPVSNVKTDAIAAIHAMNQKPLAMYIFSNDTPFVDKLIARTDAGGVTVNDVLMHYSFPGFPFGGVGNSGQGRYHGWYSFAACSHEKPVLKKYASGESMNNVRNPPFTAGKAAIYKALMEEKPSKWKKYFQKISPLTILAIAGGVYFMKAKL